MGSGQSNRGKGPKGFKRTDERLQEDISQRLSDDHELDASNIEVTVRNGEVTLQGTVTERRAKRLAEEKRIAEEKVRVEVEAQLRGRTLCQAVE